MGLTGYLRADGGKGIRNLVAVVYVIECARHVAQKIALGFDEGDVHCFGWSVIRERQMGNMVAER